MTETLLVKSGNTDANKYSKANITIYEMLPLYLYFTSLLSRHSQTVLWALGLRPGEERASMFVCVRLYVFRCQSPQASVNSC